jgi:deazaflavin-dependent oxidoreductase (nitroreductase family)
MSHSTTDPIDMTEPLPELDIYAAATDPRAQQRYNELLIEQFRTTAGKVTGQFANLPVLLLKTIGAKTGATRTTPLVYFKDGERYLIIASKSGAPTNPAWYHNLVANPTASVELPNESFDVQARVAKGDEREQLFHKVVESFPIYSGYQQKTGRRIPVIVLERVTSRRRSTLRVASPTRTGEPRK